MSGGDGAEAADSPDRHGSAAQGALHGNKESLLYCCRRGTIGLQEKAGDDCQYEPDFHSLMQVFQLLSNFLNFRYSNRGPYHPARR